MMWLFNVKTDGTKKARLVDRGDMMIPCIDREIISDDVHYVLMVVTYSGSSHFTCRMNYNNRVVEYDGLKAGGKFSDVKDINAFNGVIRDLGKTKREAVQIFYKMRDD